ncbi:MAG: DUF4838 domain-containing protein, partial [Lentisphaerota bacterium]
MKTSIVLALIALSATSWGADSFAVVENGVSRMPIVVAENAPPDTVSAARDLAGYIGKISGARPAIITGNPEQLPVSAIWVGAHPMLNKVFPGKDLALKYPEEILVLSSGGNVAILGQDAVLGKVQTCSGTANAVYTFAQKYLNIRWLWPGSLGEDFPRQTSISLPALEYRFHPPFLQRDLFLFRESLEEPMREWCKVQRIYLDSLRFPAGHGFDDWWDKYHETHPEYFALQPDGSRSGYPSPGNAKVCEGEPAVWAQWLKDAGDTISADPARVVFNGSPNDASNAGICVDQRSRAWDHPDGPAMQYEWSGLVKEYVAMTDRYVTFWNKLARGLKEKYPDRALYVAGMAYGPSRPPPVAAAPADNVIIGYVGQFPTCSDAMRESEKSQFLKWSRQSSKLVFRPNIFWYSGGWHAVPSMALKNTIEDFRFLAENNCIGIVVDCAPRHWAPQGLQYYLMPQLAWDPLQDGEAIITDFCRRGFGAAAPEMREYFNLMEKAHGNIVNDPKWRASMGIQAVLTEELLPKAYSAEVLNQAKAILKRAADKVATGSKVFSDRVAFIGRGLDFTCKLMETFSVMNEVRGSSGKNTEAVKKAIALCDEREAFLNKEERMAFEQAVRHQLEGAGMQI